MRFGVSAFQGEGRADIDNTRANQINVVIILDWFSGKIKERCRPDSHAYLHGLEGGVVGQVRPDRTLVLRVNIHLGCYCNDVLNFIINGFSLCFDVFI